MVEQSWYVNSNHLVLLSVFNEEDLVFLRDMAKTEGIKFSEFKEPDMGDETTAIAFEPGKKSEKLLKKLRLADF